MKVQITIMSFMNSNCIHNRIKSDIDIICRSYMTLLHKNEFESLSKNKNKNQSIKIIKFIDYRFKATYKINI